ncbi:response regulator [Sneathiella aquimaris]|uniref:response regulator n=2 Tax=Sneathiella aquimaris TaxID=2599305 RepID=UPI002260934B|nr:response regulator [Sneathiella aquimaris]
MFDHRFQPASALLLDSQSSMRYNTRVALLNIGFGEVEAVSNHSEFMERLEKKHFDLIVGDSRSVGEDTCDLIKQIRHNAIGHNPFVNVIVTLWDASPDVVHSTIDSGTDDLIIRPMSNAHLRDRVSGLVAARKPFIVTSDYIGPERRQIVRGMSRVSQMVVPNSLQAKVENKPELDATPENIKHALQAVNDRKVTIYTELFLHHSSRILSLGADPSKLQERQELIKDMLSMNEDLEHRILGSEFNHVAAFCDALRDLLRRLLTSNEDLKEQEQELLMQIPFAIHKACKELRQSADLAFDIQDLTSILKTASQ